jgi:hypothetical protein
MTYDLLLRRWKTLGIERIVSEIATTLTAADDECYVRVAEFCQLVSSSALLIRVAFLLLNLSLLLFGRHWGDSTTMIELGIVFRDLKEIGQSLPVYRYQGTVIRFSQTAKMWNASARYGFEMASIPMFQAPYAQ